MPVFSPTIDNYGICIEIPDNINPEKLKDFIKSNKSNFSEPKFIFVGFWNYEVDRYRALESLISDTKDGELKRIRKRVLNSNIPKMMVCAEDFDIEKILDWMDKNRETNEKLRIVSIGADDSFFERLGFK